MRRGRVKWRGERPEVVHMGRIWQRKVSGKRSDRPPPPAPPRAPR